MGGELVVIERQLQAVEPQLHNALSGLMPTKRLIQTALVSCERNDKLMACTPQSIMNGVMTFAVLGLPVDGATGQGFLMPFAKKAQAVIGYKGYNTLGARAGLTITGGAVREDDDLFDFMLGDKAFVKHKPRLGSKARIIAFWAVAAANDRPPIVSVLSIDDVLAIKAKSPAVRFNADTPWKDETIGFPAMGEKSAKRRLARSTPLILEAPHFNMAARMEEAFDEQGSAAWITPERGVVLEHEVIPPRHHTDQPTAEQLISRPGPSPSGDAADQRPAGDAPENDRTSAGREVPSAEDYVNRWTGILDSAVPSRRAQIAKSWNDEKLLRTQIEWTGDHQFAPLKARVTKALEFLKPEADA